MKYALVFGGGGGKGAYEIGVWKALHELGYADRFACVIGTSVGALNGALFCLKNPELAERVWREEISQETILPFKLDVLGLLSGNLSAIYQQDGLESLLERYLPEVMPDSPDLYVCVSKTGRSGGHAGLVETIFGEETYEAEYVRLNGLSRREAIPFLLASAAIPLIYSPVRMRRDGDMCQDGDTRRDGGMLARHNVPYPEAVRMGYEKILAVSLSNETLARNRVRAERDGKPAQAENNGVADTLILCPSVSLGGVFDGTLDFSASGAGRRIARGYEDCMRIYRRRMEAFFSDAPTP